MLKNDIPANVELLYKLKDSFDLYGLTNWSAETISVAYERFQFFSEFRGIVVLTGKNGKTRQKDI